MVRVQDYAYGVHMCEAKARANTPKAQAQEFKPQRMVKVQQPFQPKRMKRVRPGYASGVQVCDARLRK
jgi:hypothetical protein